MRFLEQVTLKGALAFFLVIVAAFMTILWMLHPPTGDASQIGLLAGFVTLFIKMAADAIGFQFSSSAGSEKKDEVQAIVATKLADKVPTPPSSSAPPPPAVMAWWSLLSDTEKTALSTPPVDDRVQKFMDTAKIGRATPDDLAYLVSKGLLTSARAAEIESAKAI